VKVPDERSPLLRTHVRGGLPLAIFVSLPCPFSPPPWGFSTVPPPAPPCPQLTRFFAFGQPEPYFYEPLFFFRRPLWTLFSPTSPPLNSLPKHFFSPPSRWLGRSCPLAFSLYSPHVTSEFHVGGATDVYVLAPLVFFSFSSSPDNFCILTGVFNPTPGHVGPQPPGPHRLFFRAFSEIFPCLGTPRSPLLLF